MRYKSKQEVKNNLMELKSKDSINMLQVCLRQEHFQTVNCKEFQYIIEAFFDYRLSTIHQKNSKSCNYN